MRISRLKTLAFAAIIATTFLHMSVARADHNFYPDFGAVFTAAVVAEVAVGLTGLITAIGNAVSQTSAKPSRGWRIAGYVFGVLNVAASVLWFSAGGDAAIGGGAHLAIGGTNLGFSIYGSTRPDSPKVSLVPLTGVGHGGTPFAGVGLRVIGF